MIVLNCLVHKELVVLAYGRNAWGRVRGPGAAFVASAQRLGWTISDASSVVDDRGNHI